MNKGLLYSTRNHIQYLIITYNVKESEKVYIHTYTHTSKITFLCTRN